VSGAADLYRLLDKMDIDEDEVESASITGWVMEQIAKVPEVGDTFVMENWQVTVTATDERRVSEIRVHKTETEEDDE
jgi:CBS domain containing-hemolysin-like protein